MLIIEATGLADTSEMEKMLALPNLKDYIQLKACICLVDCQNFLKIKDTFAFVKPGNKRRLGAAKAVAGEIKIGYFNVVSNLLPGSLHYPVEITGIIFQVAGHAAFGCGGDKARTGR